MKTTKRYVPKGCSIVGPDFEFDNTQMNPNLDPIQNNCKYGYVLPDRCRYNNRLGCPCGAYPGTLREEQANQMRDWDL